jgi:hypothetical protein
MENPKQRWEYLARNLNKVPGMAIESEFNKRGQEGWEFVGITGEKKDHYAIFKRPIPNAGEEPQ